MLTGRATLWSRPGSDEQIGLAPTLAHLEAMTAGSDCNSLFFTLRAALHEPSALGVRHLVAHGLLEAESFSEPVANLLLYLLLQMATLHFGAQAAPPSAVRT